MSHILVQIEKIRRSCGSDAVHCVP